MNTAEKLRASSVTPIERIQHTLSVLCMDATPEVRAELSDLIEDVGNLVPARETLLRDLREIEHLIDEHGNANFACGEWTPENDDEEYEAASDRANFARKQLVDLISARIMNPSAGSVDGSLVAERVLNGLIGFIGNGYNARGAFPKNLTELDDDARDYLRNRAEASRSASDATPAPGATPQPGAETPKTQFVCSMHGTSADRWCSCAKEVECSE